MYSITIKLDRRTWKVYRRYSEIKELLHQQVRFSLVAATLVNPVSHPFLQLVESGVAVSAQFPNRALLRVMDQFDPAFVNERTRQLNTWMEALLTVPNITANKTFQYFIDPMNAVR
jgi:hypothetical protein